jgi:hypothetical protein
MNAMLLMLSVLASAYAGPDPEFVASVESFPKLIIGFMAVGGVVGGGLVVYSRRRRRAGALEAAPVESAPPLPTPSLRPQALESVLPPVDGTGGFSPSDDFEEPTCFAELPRKRNDD